MKLLWILPYTPTRIRTRPYYLLHALQKRGHQLTLATVWENEAEQAVLHLISAQGVRVISEKLSRFGVISNLVGALAQRKPMQQRYSLSPPLANRLRTLLAQERFEAVHVEHLRGAEYGLLALRVLKEQGRANTIVWDSVDCISLLFEQAAHSSHGVFGRWITRLELPRTRQIERQMVKTFDTTLVTSNADKSGLERLAGAELPSVLVLPNGVDASYYFPDETPKASDEIVFSGKLGYHANFTAALHLIRNVMPYVWVKRPAARVVLAGKDPPGELLRLAQSDERITVTGTLDDIRPYLRRATVAAALIPYGAGIQNKVLEAMACGTAVVGSPQAAAALQISPGKEMLVADGAQMQAYALLQLMDDSVLRRQLCMAGRSYVELHHNWQHIAGQLEGIYGENYGRKNAENH